MKPSSIRTKTTLPKELNTRDYITDRIMELLIPGTELSSLELSVQIGITRERLENVITQMSNSYLLYECEEDGVRIYGRLCRQ